LNGKNYCLKMIAVFETPRIIYLVTEYCAGGETFQYISRQEEDLRTDDVSRIAFQLLSAVDHCAKHHIIHRDIKPENIMMMTPSPGSDLRLIDFGSSTDEVVEDVHTAFAGSAFYISPELFQRIYNVITDVWSAGVCLYVIVAGYPANKLQRAFNMLQSNDRNVKQLPNMPDDMPDSYYDLFEGTTRIPIQETEEMLVICYNKILYNFHKHVFSVENILLEAASAGVGREMDSLLLNKSKTHSIEFRGIVSSVIPCFWTIKSLNGV
jgi:serine/threonine protein kinase